MSGGTRGAPVQLALDARGHVPNADDGSAFVRFAADVLALLSHSIRSGHRHSPLRREVRSLRDGSITIGVGAL